jgi:transposase
LGNQNQNDMLLIKISDAEIQKLSYERYCYPCPIVQKRIFATYLKATTESSNKEIGRIVGLDRDSVSHWIKVYHENGVDALYRYNYGTNKSKLEPHSTSILESFKERPPMSACEAKSRIEAMTGISRSLSQVRAFMKRHGLRYLKAGHIPAKADAEKQQYWLQNTLEPVMKEAENKECHLLFMDAVHFILQPFICALWCKARMFIKASAGRNRINVLGVVDAITKEVITISNTTYINAETVVSFLKKLREHYKDLPIKIVLDNARYQHCKFVEDIALSLDITLLFLPSYSPNLNIIERLWKFTKKKILYAKYYETPDKFHKAINGFFKTINLEHAAELKNLLSLKFQVFQNENAEIYPV